MTEKQKKRKAAHKRACKLYLELKGEAFDSKTELWERLSKKTGFSREWLQNILRKENIKY